MSLVKKCDNCKGEEVTWPPGWIAISANWESWDAFAHVTINGDYCSFQCAIATLQKALAEQESRALSK